MSRNYFDANDSRNFCSLVKEAKKYSKNNANKLREQYDNNSNIACSVATLLGAGIAIIFDMNLWLLFIFAFVGNAADNAFYLYIYYKLRRATKNEGKLQK